MTFETDVPGTASILFHLYLSDKYHDGMAFFDDIKLENLTGVNHTVSQSKQSLKKTTGH